MALGRYWAWLTFPVVVVFSKLSRMMVRVHSKIAKSIAISRRKIVSAASGGRISCPSSPGDSLAQEKYRRVVIIATVAVLSIRVSRWCKEPDDNRRIVRMCRRPRRGREHCDNACFFAPGTWLDEITHLHRCWAPPWSRISARRRIFSGSTSERTHRSRPCAAIHVGTSATLTTVRSFHHSLAKRVISSAYPTRKYTLREFSQPPRDHPSPRTSHSLDHVTALVGASTAAPRQPWLIEARLFQLCAFYTLFVSSLAPSELWIQIRVEKCSWNEQSREFVSRDLPNLLSSLARFFVNGNYSKKYTWPNVQLW